MESPFPQPNQIGVALAGLPDVSGPSLRAVIDRLAGMGCRAASFSCNAPGLRPRELGRSARRDLGAVLRRADLSCSGVDLFIPPKHLADPTTSARAIEAYTEAIAFTADIAQLTGAPSVLTTVLPRNESAADAIAHIAEYADRHNVRLADLAWPPVTSRPPAIAPAFDPASVIPKADEDTSALAARYAKQLGAARLSDTDDSGRCIVGEGHLDTLTYLLSLSAGGYRGPVVIDVRGLKDPYQGVEKALSVCAQLPTPGANA